MHSLRRFTALVVLLAMACAAYGAESGMTVEQLIAKHRAAIGSEQALKAANSRVAEGTSVYRVLSGGAGTSEGKATLVSDGSKLREVWKLNAPDYKGEDFIANGDKVWVGKGFLDPRTRPDPARSLLGGFLWTQSTMLRDGLFAGALSTAWPILDPKMRDAKLSYQGLKTVDGQQLHEVVYKAKKSADTEIRLYFDPESFRHVLTVATMSISPRLLSGATGLDGNFMGREAPGQTMSGSKETLNSRQQTIRYKLVQRFGAFQQFDGLTLPTSCDVHFSAEGYEGSEVSYTLNFSNVQNNVTLNPKNFEVK